MKTIGIDPGLRGAIAWIADGEAEAIVKDLPVITDGALSWIDGAALLSMLIEHGVADCRCVIERVSAMPKQGVSSSFNFGVNYGSVLGVLQAAHIPLTFVSPVKWKRDLGLASKEKHVALHRARLMFPNNELHLAKHDGRAEALLIAHWARNWQ